MRTPLLSSLILSPLVLAAQTPLPYTTGFDNAAQQAGWTQFRTGHLSNYSWTLTTAGSVSPPEHLWHDYPVGGAETDTVRDWYVSPPFDLSAGASLTLKVNVYSIMGSTMPSDALRIYLLSGSNDPQTAALQVLADLTPLVTSSSDFTQPPSVVIPPTTGTSHVAFFYQATQNWFTPGIDDVSISAAPIGVQEPEQRPIDLLLLGQHTLVVRGNAPGAPVHLRIFGSAGTLELDRTFRDRMELDPAVSDGVKAYVLQDAADRVIRTGRFVRVR